MVESDGLRLSHRISVLNGILAAPAAVSLAVGVRNGLRRSQDMQWSGSHLLAERVDPYLQFLNHDPEHRLLLSQVPNYLHELYLVMLPLGLLPFGAARAVWVAVNLVLAGASVVLLGRIYELQRSSTILLGSLLVLSTPFRVLLGNGQQSMLEMVLLVLLLVTIPGRGLVLGLSYFKYSFSPVFWFYYLFRARWRLLLWAFIPPVIGGLIFWMIVHGSFVTVVLEPFAVSRAAGGVSDGTGDVMTLAMQISRHMAGVEVTHVGILLAILASGAMAYVVARRQCADVASFPALACASLMLLVHLSYDFVLLAIPLAANLGAVERKRRWYGFALVGILLYVAPEVRRVLPHAPELAMTLFSFAMLTAAFVYFLPERSADSAPEPTSGLCPQN